MATSCKRSRRGGPPLAEKWSTRRNHRPRRGLRNFPLYDPAADQAEIDATDLSTETGFCNYSGVEEDNEVAAEFERMTASGYVRKFTTEKAAKKYLGKTPVYSKIGVIKKCGTAK